LLCLRLLAQGVNNTQHFMYVFKERMIVLLNTFGLYSSTEFADIVPNNKKGHLVGTA